MRNDSASTDIYGKKSGAGFHSVVVKHYWRTDFIGVR